MAGTRARITGKSTAPYALWIGSFLLGPFCAAGSFASSTPSYHLTHQYAIGGEGGWDYLTIDSEGHRLDVSHSKQVEVIDADTGIKIGIIRDTPGVHGTAIAADLHRGFTSNGGDSSVSIFDTRTLQTIKKIAVNKPDFILYDNVTHRVFPLSQKVTVLDSGGEIEGEVDLGGTPEAAAADDRGSIFVNLEDKDAVVKIDAKSLKITKTYPAHCNAPHSLSYDRENKRLLVGCKDGFRALDADTGQLVGGSILCAGADAGAFDPQTKMAFESCAEGVVSVIAQLTPDLYELVQSAPTQLWAKTMAYDFRTKRIYLATADLEWVNTGESTKKESLSRRVKPGTFRVLVLEP
jgi:DNA-binding beta-propeller fold protein YncE